MTAELIVIDEFSHAPLAGVAADLLFQVIAERAENTVVTLTANRPFSKNARFLQKTSPQFLYA